jgi:hypothetical protein
MHACSSSKCTVSRCCHRFPLWNPLAFHMCSSLIFASSATCRSSAMDGFCKGLDGFGSNVKCESAEFWLAVQLLSRVKPEGSAGGSEEGIDAPLLPEVEAAPQEDDTGRPSATSTAPSSPNAVGRGSVRMMGVRIQEPMVADSMTACSGTAHRVARRGRAPVRTSSHSKPANVSLLLHREVVICAALYFLCFCALN